MPTLREKALALYEQTAWQFHNQDTRLRTFTKVGPEYVFDLLSAAGPFVKERAKELVMRMVTKKWQISAAPHEGGKAANAALHITVEASDGKWHLYCKELPGSRLYIVDITPPNWKTR